MPIIIQSFEFAALEKFATLSDLPLVQLVSYSSKYDFEKISTVAHAVGPDAQWIMNPLSLSDKQKDWDHSTITDTYSTFIEQMHAYDMAVHPYTLQDDKLKYTSTVYDEAQLYVDQGIDGVFCEFPHTVNSLFTQMGTKAAWPQQQSEDP